MSIPLICIALLGFLCFALGFYVSMARVKERSRYGGDVNPESKLYKAQRAHGNTIEYAPMLAVIIYILGQSPQPNWVVWSMVLATTFRYLIVAGILIPATMAEPSPMRMVGSVGTYVAGLVLVAALITEAAIG